MIFIYFTLCVFKYFQSHYKNIFTSYILNGTSLIYNLSSTTGLRIGSQYQRHQQYLWMQGFPCPASHAGSFLPFLPPNWPVCLGSEYLCVILTGVRCHNSELSGLLVPMSFFNVTACLVFNWYFQCFLLWITVIASFPILFQVSSLVVFCSFFSRLRRQVVDDFVQVNIMPLNQAPCCGVLPRRYSEFYNWSPFHLFQDPLPEATSLSLNCTCLLQEHRDMNLRIHFFRSPGILLLLAAGLASLADSYPS